MFNRFIKTIPPTESLIRLTLIRKWYPILRRLNLSQSPPPPIILRNRGRVKGACTNHVDKRGEEGLLR